MSTTGGVSRAASEAGEPAAARSWRAAHLPAVVAGLAVAVALLLPVDPVLEWLSSLPLLSSWLDGDDSGQRLPGHADKLVHLVLFAALAPFVHRSAELWSRLSPLLGGALVAGAVGTVAYSGVLEALQGLTGRSADPLDLIANAIGVGMYVAFVLVGRP